LASWSRAITEFSQPPQQFNAFHPVHCENASLDVLIIRKQTTLATNFAKNPPTLANISNFKYLSAAKKKKKLPPYAMNYKICLMKLVV
jgi:hypothetical protein